MRTDVSPDRRPLWVALAVVAVLAAVFAIPADRRLGLRFLDSLRMDKPQAVNINLSQFVGPDANQSLQHMVTQMISDKVVTTVDENPQDATDAAAASQVAGFPVKLLSTRKDLSQIVVGGAHAYSLAVDRARLQAIFDEAGRKDLTVPASVDGATVAVKVPRSVIVRYGTCPGPSSAAANVATPPPATTRYDDCLVLREGPSPVIDVPNNIDLSQLTEIGLELAGMAPDQARQFLKSVDWRGMLGVSFPRFMRSYQAVTVNGVPGTLLTLAGRRGPNYALFWAKGGIVYSLTGFGDSSQAVKLAESVS